MEIRFEWDNSSADIGHYDCDVYEVDGDKKTKIDDISLWDYTNEWQQEDARKNRYFRAYAFEVHCWSMTKGFGADDDYKSRRDENGKLLFGYNGTCDKSLDDVKRWCEEWIAQRYIKNYQEMLASLEALKQRSEALKKQGYGDLDLTEKG